VAFAAFGMKYVFDYRITERGLYILLARLIPLKVNAPGPDRVLT